MPRTYIPSRGDIIWLKFTLQAGHEQAGHRPALVISPHQYNQKVGLGLFCPVTSHVKGYPFEVNIPDNLMIKGVILSDQIKSLDWKIRKAKLICKLPNEVIEEVLAKIKTLID